MHRLLLSFSLLLAFTVQAQDQPSKKELKARSLLEAGKPYKAIALCDDHLAGSAADPRFYVLRADGYNRIGEYAKAMTDARKSRALYPTSVEALYQLALAEQGVGHTDSAIVHLQQVLERSPTAEARFQLALLHQRKHNYNEALNDVDAADAMGGELDKARTARVRGECLALLGDTVRARLAYDQALEVAPRDPVIWNSRGFHLYAAFGKHALAVHDFDRAIKLNPNYSYAFNNRGWSLYKLGDREKALDNIALAARKRSSNPYVYRNLGVIKLESGDKPGACAAFRTALEQGFTDLFGNEVQELVAANCPEVVAPVLPSVSPPVQPSNAPSNAPDTAPVKRSNAP